MAAKIATVMKAEASTKSITGFPTRATT